LPCPNLSGRVGCFTVFQSVLPERPASYRRVIFRACVLSRLQHPWPSHNIRNPSPCLYRVGPSLKGPFHPGTTSLRFVRRRITECCVKSWSVRPTSWCASSVEVFWKLIRFQSCRSRASPPAAPRRPPAQALRAPISRPPAATRTRARVG
jgi:hypothetical protein